MEMVKVKGRVLTRDAVMRYAAYFALLFLLGKAGLSATVRPFAFSFFAALLLSDKNAFILTPVYIAAVFLGSPDLLTFMYFCIPAFIFTAVYLLHFFLGKKINRYLFSFYIILSHAVFMLYNTHAADVLYEKITCATLSVIFGNISLHILKAVFGRGLKYKLSGDELISLAAVAMAAVAGLAGINVFGLEISRIVVPYALLAALYVFGAGPAVIIAVIFGLGASLYTGDITPIAAFTVWTALAACFKSLSRFAAAAALVLIDLVLGYYFRIYGEYGFMQIVPLAVGATAFALTPRMVTDKLADALGGIRERQISRHIINRNRLSVCGRLYEMSEVFGEMERVFKSMVKGVMTPAEARTALVRECEEKVCYDCPERVKCWRTRAAETEEAFSDICVSALERGKAGLLDLSPYMTNYCKRVNAALSAVNELAREYRQYVTMTKNMDSGRVLIGEQLGGVSRIMRSLADETRQTVSFDTDLERRVLEELTVSDIICREVIIYGSTAEKLAVTALVHKKDSYSDKLSAVVSKAVRVRMMVTARENSAHTGWTVVYLKPAPLYDALFGQAATAKTGSTISGDTHSIAAISEDKCMLALCDGMGSGESAEKTSSTAISLIENFYRAGFDNDIILSGVNKLISVTCDEVFAALDICVFDLSRGMADFIKLGAVPGFVLTASGVEIIKSGSLPVGVLERVKPVITKKAVSAGDVIVIVTDGIYDAFGGTEKLADFVRERAGNNPQKLADEILAQAVLYNNGTPEDDMTVAVALIVNKATF